MSQRKLWQVRVKRLVEDWVSITADTPGEAEDQAATLPMVSFVYRPSAVPAGKLASEYVPAIGVEDDEERR